MRLITLIAIDLVLGAAAIFGVLIVTASDHPTNTQGAIAWTLLAVLVILAITLVAIVVTGVRRRIPLKASRTR
jgi:preprotein translocase subunit SecY